MQTEKQSKNDETFKVGDYVEVLTNYYNNSPFDKGTILEVKLVDKEIIMCSIIGGTLEPQHSLEGSLCFFPGELKKVKEVKLQSKVQQDCQNSKIKILHFVQEKITFAYENKKGSDIIKFSTALCHKNDHYTKKIGRELALDNFNAGKTVQFRLAKGLTPENFLRSIVYDSVC